MHCTNRLCAVAVLALTLFHPGLFFNYTVINREELLKEKLGRKKNRKHGNEKSSHDDGIQSPKDLTVASASDGSDAELGMAGKSRSMLPRFLK